MRRTKIVCTLGPSSGSREIVERLVHAGMNVARLNFSHGTHDTHRRVFDTVRSVSNDLGSNVAILMDLQGPKIRTGKLVGGEKVLLEDGASFTLTTQPILGDAKRISTTYQNLPSDVRPGDRILIADGLFELRVESISGPDVRCTVLHGGLLGEHKGINLPGVRVSAPSVTEKDLEDLEFALDLDADYIALSFVRKAEDILSIKRRIADKGKTAHVVAKIERPEALESFDAILEAADAVMVARGDLGVEVDLARVPQIQKSLIRLCNERGVPVITATQMLESMMSNPRPTRAEAADVANAVYDGTDAVMLSGETASGAFPVEAVQIMEHIVRGADEAIAASPLGEVSARLRESPARPNPFREAVGQAVVRVTQVMDFKRIVVLTQSGYSAESVSRYRPRTPITAITLSEEARRRCALIWGVDAVASVVVENVDDMLRIVDDVLLAQDLAQRGDPVVIVAGMPLGRGGRTNLMKLHYVAEASDL
ncbi:MAG: pyruvate kinase [Candidatus Hydrogenedentales bacterium]|jgi:pyruvate kinase